MVATGAVQLACQLRSRLITLEQHEPLRLQDDIEYRDTLGRRGYQAWGTKWTAEVHMDKYFELIEQVAARRKFAQAAG